ncbi:MAG TPA: hypothetical protein VFQ23_03980, partial [Anaerolineales bacterium]|nr:hypothetical protein [Anaerolineales bacterium]
TRAMSALVTLIAAIAVGLVLRDIFKLKYWWTGTLFLSITPAWFLHSRTAFETAEFVAFYAGTLCAYLYDRYKSPGYLNLTVFMGALAFYTYSPGQVIVPLTALGLLISDWRYHWENRRAVLIGLAFAVILAVPYIRYIINNPSTPFAHLHTLWSYWYENIPFSEKLIRYLSEFGVGLSPWYWYVPNNRDLARHLMKEYGHILIVTLPFALWGLIQTLRNLHNSAHRAILLALLISPAAAALVQISITRTLVFVVPAALLTAIGLEQVLGWLEDPKKHMAELSEGAGTSKRRLIAALIVVLVGIPVALVSTENTNRFILLSLTFILGIQVSGVLERWARSITGAEAAPPTLWKLSPAFIAIATFALLAGANIRMLNDAIRNGPLWYRDYGLGGMQYGGFQIFNIIDEYLNDRPDSKIIFSPDWANGADVLARFFLDNPSSIRIGSVQGHITQLSPLDDNTLFIMTPQEYNAIKENPKFAEVDVETIIPYPDDSPGFYFVRLRYVDNIEEIFAAEQSVRQALRESILKIEGQDVKLRHSYLDSEDQAKWIALVFDNDPFTVTKTLETNPFVLEMIFPETRTINGFSIIIGSANVQITLNAYPTADAEPLVYTFEGQGAQNQPELSFNLPEAVQVQVLRFEVLDLRSSDRAKVHIWELKLR